MTQAEHQLLQAAKRVVSFWDATCKAHPERTDWEDHPSFYALSQAVDAVDDER